MPNVQELLKSKKVKKIIIGTFICLCVLMWLGTSIYNRYFITTEDAYVNGRIIQVAPRVTGKVMTMYVGDNQFVKEGDPLFALDPEPLTIAVASAKAQVQINEALVEESNLQAKRTLSLVKNHYASPQTGDSILAQLKTANGKLELAKSELQQALLNMRYTTVTAPASGWITNNTLQAGTIVTANQPVFALVANQGYWIDANFKETEIANIKPGQAATVVLDIYPHYAYQAVVESISNGTGSAFSLLPPQNATGNWVKVTQRIPIKIRILNPNEKYPLRIGASAEVKVHLQRYVS